MSIPQDNPTSKRCTRCGEVKPLDEFGRDVTRVDGLRKWCRACTKAYASNQQVKDRTNARYRERYREEPEYRAKVRERGNARTRLRWRNDPAYRERKNSQKAQYNKTIPYRNKRKRRWHQRYYNDPVFRRKHLDRSVIHAHKRRVRIEAAGPSYTYMEWIALCKQFHWRCAACGKKKWLTVDHVVPVSRGGDNTISNVQPLCRDCNYAKYTRTIDYRVPHGPEQLTFDWDD